MPLISMQIEVEPEFLHPCGFIRLRERHRVHCASKRLTMLQVVEPDRPPDLPKIELDAEGRKIYDPDGAVLMDFLECRKHVSIVRGSIGSGTSTACIMKMWSISCEQRPNGDGVRKTRWAVCRNTFPDLKNTTVKSWLDWFPEEMYGRFYWDRPFKHIIRLGDVEMEVIFLALDSEDDIRKLRSFEFTGIWFNELEFIEKAILDEAESRTGRYPAVKDGGATWDGVLADMNAPREDVLADARHDNSPLHSFFEWNDGAAAEQFRLQQARGLIRAVVAVYVSEDKPAVRTRAYIHVPEPSAPHYREASHAMSLSKTRNMVLERAWNELKAWRARYKDLKEFADLISVIDEMEIELPKFLPKR